MSDDDTTDDESRDEPPWKVSAADLGDRVRGWVAETAAGLSHAGRATASGCRQFAARLTTDLLRREYDLRRPEPPDSSDDSRLGWRLGDKLRHAVAGTSAAVWWAGSLTQVGLRQFGTRMRGGRIAEDTREKLPRRPSMADSDRTGAKVGDALRNQVSTLLANIALLVSKLVPGSQRFWKGLINLGYKGFRKKTGADVIGHILVGGEIKHVPLNFDYEKGRYENPYGDWWKVPSEADAEYRVAGAVPAVWASANSNEVGSHVQAEVAEVLDLGESDKVYRSADVQHIIQGDQNQMSGGQAVADGGTAFQSAVSVNRPGVFEDELVDLSTGDTAGRVVSMEKYYETYPSKVAPEEMKNQEERGRLAEEDRDYGSLALKMLLVAVAGIILFELGPVVLNLLFGGGGSGGGGTGTFLPGMITPLLGLV